MSDNNTAVAPATTWAQSIERFLTANAPHGVGEWYHSKLETRVMAISRDEMPEELRSNSAWNVSFPNKKFEAEEEVAGRNRWSLQDFCSRVGATGWNYVQGVAEYATFEFDCEDGHDDGLSTEQIEQLADQIGGWCEVRRSTHGKGIHCRVKFAEPVPVESRSEYAALCRYTVAQMGKQFDQDFLEMTCGVGCILWIHSRTTTTENGGFELLYPQSPEAYLEVEDDWRGQVPARTLRSHDGPAVELDDEHQRLIDWLAERGFPTTIHHMGDGQCIQTHTRGLLAAYEALNLRGVFSTISAGNETHEQNCYMFPRIGGAWQVFRYNTVDEPTWNKRQTDNRSWCWFNLFDPFDDRDWNALCVQFEGSRKDPLRSKT